MNVSLEYEIKKWLDENLDRVPSGGGTSIHIDELLGRVVQAPEIIGISLDAFGILVEQMKQLQFRAQPVLVIPLVTISNRLERAVPRDLDGVVQQLDVQRPGLYLVDWKAPKWFAEEYRLLVTFKLMQRPLDDVDVYYREFRSPVDIENDWEFSRSLNVEYLPKRAPRAH